MNDDVAYFHESIVNVIVNFSQAAACHGSLFPVACRVSAITFKLKSNVVKL